MSRQSDRTEPDMGDSFGFVISLLLGRPSRFTFIVQDTSGFVEAISFIHFVLSFSCSLMVHFKCGSSTSIYRECLSIDTILRVSYLYRYVLGSKGQLNYTTQARTEDWKKTNLEPVCFAKNKIILKRFRKLCMPRVNDPFSWECQHPK